VLSCPASSSFRGCFLPFRRIGVHGSPRTPINGAHLGAAHVSTHRLLWHACRSPQSRGFGGRAGCLAPQTLKRIRLLGLRSITSTLGLWRVASVASGEWCAGPQEGADKGQEAPDGGGDRGRRFCKALCLCQRGRLTNKSNLSLSIRRLLEIRLINGAIGLARAQDVWDVCSTCVGRY
jgi:hypothetical protein